MSKLLKKYLPVIDSSEELRLPWEALRVIIGGKSIIDTNEIRIKSEKDAELFLNAYGLNTTLADDVSSIRLIIDFSIEYLNKIILVDNPNIIIPDQFRCMSATQLLKSAAELSYGKNPKSGYDLNWPCIILKVCHAAAHALWEHDLEAHEKAIDVIEERLKPYLYESHGSWWIGDDLCSIPLVEHSIKREKHLFRVITKLLHKPGNISSSIRDHVGLRFVVEDVFCAVLLITFLKRRNVFMYANNIPEEARNSLVGLDEIQKLYEAYGPPAYNTSDSIESVEVGKINEEKNPFSSSDFGMIKMVQRLLVTLPSGRRTFFPYELQILTRSKLEHLSTGEAAHDAYEKRQVDAVKKRLFPSVF